MSKARGRILSPEISTSERVNMLSTEAALLYTWLLAHADDQGRMSGNVTTIKAVVVPLRNDLTIEDVKRCLGELEDIELIKIYSASELGAWSPHDEILQIVNWWDYQRLSNPRPSKYPAMRGWIDKLPSQPRDAQGRYAADR